MSFPHIYIIYFYFLLSFLHSSPLSTSFCHFLRLLFSFLSHFSLTVSSFYMLFIFTYSVSPSLLSYFLSAALFLHPLDLFLIVLALLSLHFLFFCLTSKSILSSPLSSFHFFLSCTGLTLFPLTSPFHFPPFISLVSASPLRRHPFLFPRLLPPLSLFLHHLSLLLSFSRHLLSPPPQLLSSPTKKRNEGEEAGVMSEEGMSVEEVELSLKSQHGNNSYSAQTSSRRHSSTSRPLHPAPLHLLFTSSAVSLSCLSYCSPCLFLISIIRQGFQIFLSFFFSLSEFFMFRKEMLLERTQSLAIIK